MKTLWPLPMLLLFAGCGDKGGDAAADKGEVTETVMDNVDDLHGTIGDDMIAIDDLRSQAPTGEESGAIPASAVPSSEDGLSADGSAPADSGGDPETESE